MATFNWMVNQLLICSFAAHSGQNRECVCGGGGGSGWEMEKWEVGRVKVIDVESED